MSEPLDVETVHVQHGAAVLDDAAPADPPSGNAPVLAALVCTAPRCPNRGQHVQIHTDTVLPVHCGGCGTVLHCQHQPGDPQTSGGDLDDPVEHTIVHCRVCRSELSHDRREVPPAELIDKAPPGIAAILRHLAAR